jgi:hypothetical protein
VENKKYFFCYSYKLKLFLKEKGLRFEFAGNNPNNEKPYWGYLKTDKLNQGLKEWGEKNNYTGEGKFDNFYKRNEIIK